MKLKELYNFCLGAVTDGLEDMDVVVSNVSIVEDFTAVVDDPVVMLDIDFNTNEMRIFGSKNTPEELDSYEELDRGIEYGEKEL